MYNYGNALKFQRETRNLTQTELAKKNGYNTASVKPMGSKRTQSKYSKLRNINGLLRHIAR